MSSSTMTVSGPQVVIAVDPSKASWTAVAVDYRLQPLAAVRVEVNRDGYGQLRRFARRWRMLSTGHGRKTDEADALSCAH